jgi:dTDP-4-dehydrorhamnose reductase
MHGPLLVTGASGYLGHHVCRAALAAGHREVHGTWWTAVPKSARHISELQMHHVDLRSFQELGALLMRVRPEAIVHTAYRQDDPEPWPLNLAAPVRLAGAAVGLGARLVVLSTDLVFSGRDGAPYAEDAPTDPLDAYGAGKARMEEAVLERCPEATVVRTSLLLGGAEDRSRHEQAALDDAMAFFGDEVRSPVAVQDLAAALVELVGRDDLPGLLHLGGPDDVTRHELAELVAGAPRRRASGPPDRPKDCRLDSSWAARTLTTALRGARELLTAGSP